ncbi:MAG: M23 family metallopeptidase [bacterium]|nr:M23 family metallopeptidase [bacterium]
MRQYLLIIVIAGALYAPRVFAHGGELLFTPESVMQGEPFMVTVKGTDIRDVKTLTFDGKRIPVFVRNGKPTAFIGVDLSARPGKHTVKLLTLDLDRVEKKITIQARRRVTAPLGIPQKLGGNTKVAQQNLVTVLSKENGVLAKVKVTDSAWFKEAFSIPLKDLIVTDAYGYSRETGSYSIPHKGTDFRASLGTQVKAINDGVVRLSRDFTVYGKTVAIDHGGGVVSFSMHLSKLAVKEGQKVTKGELIGFSGDTGYAERPHLHLSVRLNGVSIDPMKFFALFDTKKN